MSVYKFGYLSPHGVKPEQYKEYVKELVKKNYNKIETNIINRVNDDRFKKFIEKYKINYYDYNIYKKIMDYLDNNHIDMVSKYADNDYVIRYCASEKSINKYSIDSGPLDTIGYWYRVYKYYDNEPFIRNFELEYIVYNKYKSCYYEYYDMLPHNNFLKEERYNEEF